MPKERTRAPFASLGADMKEARKALGYTQTRMRAANTLTNVLAL